MGHLTFNEKSAWAMVLVLMLAAVIYLNPVLGAYISAGTVIPPGPIAVLTVIAMIVFSILFHIVLAISNPSEAKETRDERDKFAIRFAGHWSGIVLGLGVVTSLLAYFVFRSGDILFHCIFVSLILASLIEYVLIILAYRRGF